MIVKVNQPILRVVSAGALSLLLTAGLHLVRIPGAGAPDFSCSSSSMERVEVSISSGESGSSIAESLFTKGVVKSSQAYFRVAVGDQRSAKVAPGLHNIDKRICASQALDQLLDSSRIGGLINITEGMWVSEVIPQMIASGFSKEKIQQAMAKATKPSGFTSLEGLLFPAQYSFDRETSADQAVSTMISRATSEMKSIGMLDYSGKFTSQQLLIIASLIQAEGNTEDFSKISQVIRNRLTIGMPLQFDSTVHYIKKSRGSVFLSTQSTLISSPFNTYRKYGLPPGPINNPGLLAMRAAINPASGDWLYFITVAPFDTRFTKDLSQFNNWKIEYKKNLRDGKFRSKK